jgi:SNF2 family DNA or RNA helicase
MKALSDSTAELLKPLKLWPEDRLELSVADHMKRFDVRVKTTDGRMPSPAAARTWIMRCPERRQLEDMSNHWLLAATDYTAEIIRAVWPEERITFTDEARGLYEYLIATGAWQDRNAERVAVFKATGEPGDSLNGAAHPELPPTKYQRCAADVAIGNEGYALFMDPGTGKTLVFLLRLLAEARAKRDAGLGMYRSLVVCPKGLRLNWKREIERFTTLPGKVSIAKGGKFKRMGSIIETLVDELDCYFGIVIMSYEGMTRDVEALLALGELGEWDLVVLDESHYIKGDTNRARAAHKLRDKAKQRMIATGTPYCNGPTDLYNQFEFLGEGWSGFRSRDSFREFYGVFNKAEGESYRKLVSVQNMAFMKERLSRLSFMITKEEAMPDLPAKTYDVREVEMTARQAEVYKRVAEDLLLEIDEELEGGDADAMTVSNILVKLLRLAQICSGFVVYDGQVDVANDTKAPGRLEWIEGENPKLEELVTMLKEERTPDQKTIVACCFVPSVLNVSKRLAAEGIKHVRYHGSVKEAERTEAERMFNEDPDCRVMVGNPATFGIGLNLLGYPYWDAQTKVTTNCDRIVVYDQDWSFSKREQLEARPHRKGTRVSIQVTDLVMPDTIDEDIRLRVMQKKHSAMDLVDVRAVLSGILEGLGRQKEEGNDD